MASNETIASTLGSDEMQNAKENIYVNAIIFNSNTCFAAGLILYWVCTNILTIIQQYIINRSIKVKS